MGRNEAATLPRLLVRRETESLLNAFTRVVPGMHFALLLANGRPFVTSEHFPSDALVTPNGLTHSYPLRASDQSLGTLVLHGARDADALARAPHYSLTLSLTQAIARREIADEALEGYREINLMYRLSETLSVSLDPKALSTVVLTESQNAIKANVGLLLLRATHDDTWIVQNSFGDAAQVETLFALALSSLKPLLPSTRPEIITDLSEQTAFDAFLWAPMLMQSEALGGILLARAAGQPVFSAGDEKLLLTLAREAAIGIENARLIQVALEKERLDHELRLAHEMQASLMPRATPQVRDWEFAHWWQPAREMSGDFYDFIPLDQQLDFVIADVSDKGMAAALFMAVTRSTVRASTRTTRAAAEALTQANRVLCADAIGGTFVTLFYAQLDPFLNQLTYVNAGHNPPLLCHADGPALSELPRTGIMLGFDETFQFEQRKLRLRAGDVLVFYTDGVTEAVNARKEQFGEERLYALVRAQRDESATDLLRTLKQSLTAFMGETPAYDDITLIVAKCVAPESGGRVQGQAGTMRQFAFSADAQLESLALFREFVERACADADVHPDTCFQLSLVVDEACANVIQYGYADLPRTPIELTFANDGEQVVITIADRARPFAPEQAPAPDLSSGWEERRVGGLGWHLIRSLVNEVRYESLPDGRNVLTLVKRLDKRSDETH